MDDLPNDEFLWELTRDASLARLARLYKIGKYIVAESIGSRADLCRHWL